ncbi:MAG: Bug family tripartite tricarboxylate transporter substrate binding protein [Burkholderiales bacterium]
MTVRRSGSIPRCADKAWRVIARSVLLAAMNAGVAISTALAQEQNFPIKAIRVIVPFTPGDTADVLARLIGPKMSERMGQQVIVENRAGASGQIGMELAARAAPDGYTIAVGQGGNLAVAPHTYKKMAYDPLKDLAPVALLATNFLGVVANLKEPFNSVAEMIAWAKAHPGKLTLGTNGEGGFPHLAFESLRTMAGFTFTHVPYKGTGPMITDLLGGQVQIGIGAFTTFSPQVKAGKMRLLGITNPTRVALDPALPLVAEAVPGYDSRGWFGYVAPAGTPPDIVARLNDEINRAMRQPDVSEKLVALGLVIVTESPEYFGNLIRTEHAKYGKLARDIGFQAQ